MSKRLQKYVWFLLFTIVLLGFCVMIYVPNIPILILIIILATIIHFKGNEIMFGKFDRERKARIKARGEYK